MSWDLHRALRCTCGIQHRCHCDRFPVFQHILCWWVLSWTQRQNVASSFTDVYIQPNITQQISH